MLTKEQLMPFLYKKDGNKRVSGFWKDSLYDIYKIINLAQENISGNLCEIGVYCGRSFIPLVNLKRQDERVVGIDVFEKTFYRDIKNSFNSVNRLVKEAFGSDPFIHIISKDSKTILAKKLLYKFKPFRLFSIDGDHSVLGTLRDLIIAKETTADDGIIFLDDYDNPRFSPTVLEAVDIFLEYCNHWQVLFTSTEKMFLCSKSQVMFYLPMLSLLPDNWSITKLDFPKYKYINKCPQVENKFGKNSWICKDK